MKVTGSYTFDADVQTVWDSMLSPDALSGCIPGCDRFSPSGDDSYDVEMTVRIASIRGSYKGAVKIEDKVHLQSYRMVVTGSGRGGSVQGSGDLSFSENNGKTTVEVTGESQVTGVVARVGQRLIGGATRMMMNQFFDCLRPKIEK